MPMQLHHPRRGSALLSVLVILMLAGIMVVGMQQRQKHGMQRTVQFISAVQAWHYALGGEAYARQLIHKNYNPDLKVDYPEQAWRRPGPPFALPEEGSIAIIIEDLQGRFNLNSLEPSNIRAKEIFLKLLAEAGVQKASADALILALAGATNPHASLSPVAGSCVGTPFLADASQLLDFGLSVDSYRKIAPYVTALPNSCINLNINAVSGPLEKAALGDEKKLSAMKERRSKNGYLTAGDIAALGLGLDIVASSQYFNVQVTVTLDSGPYGLSTIIHRDIDENNQIVVHTMARNWKRCTECYP